MRFNCKMEKTKKIIASFIALAMVITVVKAQKQIKEGVVVYSASYDIPADQLQNYSTLPTEITIYFRGDSTAAMVNQNGAIIKGVSVLKNNYHSMIVDIPANGKRIVVVMTPAEVEQEKATNPQFSGKSGTEKQKINGYNCTKTTITDTKTGAFYDIWVTNDIDMVPNSLSNLVSTFGGVPIKFVTFNRGIKINAELIDISETPVPPGFFSATKDYQPMSFEQLKAM